MVYVGGGGQWIAGRAYWSGLLVGPTGRAYWSGLLVGPGPFGRIAWRVNKVGDRPLR